jgi:nicotinic acid mononucleotide adenylyltransferase
MIREQAISVFNDIKEISSKPKFATRYAESSEIIAFHLNKPAFTEYIEEILKHKNFTGKAVINLTREILTILSKGYHPDSWLKVIYQYTLSKSFPEAMEMTVDPVAESACLYFLEVYRLFNTLQKTMDEKSFQSAYAFYFLEESEIMALESPLEYRRFKQAFKNDYIYEMMKLNQEIMGYTTLDHICGVHYLAMRLARQLKALGISVDLGRVSGAAAGHDIGKYGCKPEEARRVAYYHYYYTGEWFEKRHISYIRNIAVNHSTWDLELENLPIESLILIYSDFCVKAPESKDYPYAMQFYALKESFDVILNKLDDVDEAKEKRYRKVYAKLKDFESFMLRCGVDVGIDTKLKELQPLDKSDTMYVLLHGSEIASHFKHLSFHHNMGLMHRLRDENALNSILENARSEKSRFNLRGYLYVLEEYFTYLTQKQKLISLQFLYENLTHSEEDIRKQCAELMGRIISTYDEKYRKELPSSIELSKPKVTSEELIQRYFTILLNQEKGVILKHRQWLATSLKYLVRSVFKNCNKSDLKRFLSYVLHCFELEKHKDTSVSYLLDMIVDFPIELCSENLIGNIYNYVVKKTEDENIDIRLHACVVLEAFIQHLTSEQISHLNTALFTNISTLERLSPAESIIRLHLARRFGASQQLINSLELKCHIACENPSDLYLSNLKSATFPIVKSLQIELLAQSVKSKGSLDVFYTAMHLCNIIKVSGTEMIRQKAGNSLIEIFRYLTEEQRNDIVIELLRALEIESYQFTKFIPHYLGQILILLKPVEIEEILTDFIEKIKKASFQISALIVKTAGVALEALLRISEETHYTEGEVFRSRLIGIVFNGLGHYHSHVNQMAFSVVGKDIFGSELLSLQTKQELFTQIGKKVLSIITNIEEDSELLFLNYASALNHLYRFISDYEHLYGALPYETINKVAFFPGAFDPFTLAHKESARQIRDLGFEVYLAVDEFSWSKRTQPNLLRRNIIKMSIADELGIYTFPRSFPVNIANPIDLQELRTQFENREIDIHIVVGSDVLMNASAYRNQSAELQITDFSHIIFDRAGDYSDSERERLNNAIAMIKSNVVRLELSSRYEAISSTQIRNYIDNNQDISDMIEPMVEKFIYERGLYRSEPQFKDTMTVRMIDVQFIENISEEMIHQVSEAFGLSFVQMKERLDSKVYENSSRMLIIRSLKTNEIIGCSMFHWLRSSHIYYEFESKDLSQYIQNNSVGRIVVIDGILAKKNNQLNDMYQVLVSETLAFCISKDYSYGIYNNAFESADEELIHVFKVQGFVTIEDQTIGRSIQVVNMSSPCTLALDSKSMLKEPYRSNRNVVRIIEETREALQEAVIRLYPGNLVLSLDRTMIYEHLISKICEENDVPTTPQVPKVLGKNILVTYGDIFKRWTLPNTITKAFHAERYYNTELSNYDIEAYPHYLDMNIQAKTIKSYNREVILVDDLMDKGYRFQKINQFLRQERVPVKKLMVAILSGRGKANMEMLGVPVDCAYFIPRLKVWFTESQLYPFIGGDAVLRGAYPEAHLIPSINLILPYVFPGYIKDVPLSEILNFSRTCIENAYKILRVIESEYLKINERSLTLSNLSEVSISPRFPDKGQYLAYDSTSRPSDLLSYDLETIKRIQKMSR